MPLAAYYPLFPSSWIFFAFLALAFLVYLFIALYFYAPIKVKSKQVAPMDVDFREIELSALPIEVTHAFNASAEQLTAAGFELLGNVSRHVERTQQNSFVSLWVNRATKDSAQIIGILTPSAQGGVKVVTLTTFRTEFKDRSAIVTSNSSTPGVFPRDPEVDSIRCAGVRDIQLLYRLHKALVGRDRRSRTATLDFIRDPVSRMRDEHTRTFDRLAKAGYFSIDQAHRRYVPTLKGAYIMTWRLLPPFKQWRAWRVDRHTDATLRDLGFGGTTAFRRAFNSDDQVKTQRR